MLFIILVVFLVCWIFFFVFMIYVIVVGKELFKYFVVGVYWFGFLNLVMNFIIYVLWIIEFCSGYR